VALVVRGPERGFLDDELGVKDDKGAEYHQSGIELQIALERQRQQRLHGLDCKGEKQQDGTWKA
jgi:hypothetical protein